MCALRVVKDTVYLFKGQLRKIARTHKIAGQNSSRRTDPMATTVHAIIKTSTDRFTLDIGTVAQYSLFTVRSVVEKRRMITFTIANCKCTNTCAIQWPGVSLCIRNVLDCLLDYMPPHHRKHQLEPILVRKHSTRLLSFSFDFVQLLRL